jgi:hypothetical protein
VKLICAKGKTFAALKRPTPTVPAEEGLLPDERDRE